MAFDLAQVRLAFPEREVYWLERCASTMVEAGRLAARGCRAGTAVGAEEQTAGQGRYGRTWVAEPGASLCVSIVLRPPLAEEDARVLSMALGLATGEAIARAADLRPDLRWPNDVLLRDLKCAGILVQVEGGAFIAGIGINVNQESFPPELEGIATSLRLAGERMYSRERLLIHLLETVDSYTAMLAGGGRAPVLRAFARASSYASGRPVRVEQDHEVLEGITDGLDASGFLRIRKDDGSRMTVLTGGVRPRE